MDNGLAAPTSPRFRLEGPVAGPDERGRLEGQPWTATTHLPSLLREFGFDPSSDRAGRAVELIGADSRCEEGGQPYWEGEVEPCINGVTVANGAHLGVDVSTIVERLLGQPLDDVAWNCETITGSVRSSFWHHDQRARGTLGIRPGHRWYSRIAGGAPLGRGVSVGAGALPSSQHG